MQVWISIGVTVNIYILIFLKLKYVVKQSKTNMQNSKAKAVLKYKRLSWVKKEPNVKLPRHEKVTI